MAIRIILFDMIGTTVMERDPAAISNSFLQAFHYHHVPVSPHLIETNRGKDKKDAIQAILQQLQFPQDLAEPILSEFKKNFERGLAGLYENEGFREIIHYLKARGIIIGVGTGLPKDLAQLIFDQLKWRELQFDFIGIAEELGRGRPYPDMILEMLKLFKIDAREFLKVGDTIADIQEGKNAGVLTAAILSGTQTESDLNAEQPDFTIRSLLELKNIIY